MRIRTTIAALVFALGFLAGSAHAATITVNSLADTGMPSICVLRDAISAANSHLTVQGCGAGSGNDTIRFSLPGSILLGSPLPQVTDHRLAINGRGVPGTMLDGNHKVQVLQVAASASLTLRNLAIVNGSANPIGGGVDNRGTLFVIDANFTENQARGPTSNSGAGGAIFSNGTLIVVHTTFTANQAFGMGGAIQNAGFARITDSTFNGNYGGQSGGAIEHDGGTLSVTRSTFKDNSVLFFGAGMTNYAPAIVTDSTFADNPGGGIENENSITVVNSTFSNDNFAIYNGMFETKPTSAVITGATLVHSILANYKTNIIDLKSSILANTPGGDCLEVGSTGITDEGYNIADDKSCGFTAIGSLNNTNPQLNPAGLANNRGPTQTIALLASSPAIDAIPFGACTDQSGTQLPTDQRGALRVDATPLLCDVGAYQFQPLAGQANCGPSIISALVGNFGSLSTAALALGFGNVPALLAAIGIAC